MYRYKYIRDNCTIKLFDIIILTYFHKKLCCFAEFARSAAAEGATERESCKN